MAESNPQKKKIPTDYISDSESSEEETNQHLHTSQEKRLSHTIKGSAQATQAALAHTTAQCTGCRKFKMLLCNIYISMGLIFFFCLCHLI